jgi:hypothetical protein
VAGGRRSVAAGIAGLRCGANGCGQARWGRSPRGVVMLVATRERLRLGGGFGSLWGADGGWSGPGARSSPSDEFFPGGGQYSSLTACRGAAGAEVAGRPRIATRRGGASCPQIVRLSRSTPEQPRPPCRPPAAPRPGASAHQRPWPRRPCSPTALRPGAPDGRGFATAGGVRDGPSGNTWTGRDVPCDGPRGHNPSALRASDRSDYL